MGLSTLLAYYPALALPADDLPGTPEALRLQAMQRLALDESYCSSLSNMFRLWLGLDATTVMQFEDFFTLPPAFQSKLLEANQAASKAGTGTDFTI
jgi:hypothetical protein